MNREKATKIVELLATPEAVEQLKNQPIEKGIEFLAQNGVSTTEKELREIFEGNPDEIAELDENSLENVTGGSFRTWLRDVWDAARGVWDGFWGK